MDAKKMTDKDRLKQYLMSKKHWKTSQIIRWGCTGGFSNGAERNARRLREEGFLRRLNKAETEMRWGKTAEKGYEVMEFGALKMQENRQYSFV